MAPPKEVQEYDYEGLPPDYTLLQNLMAGAIAGIAEHTVMYPVDSIRTRMQILTPKTSTFTGPHGIITGGSQILAKDFFGLWRGVSSVLVGAGWSS